jgi:tRNA U34 5-carboxymethylaminomethyl modifying GTPase MnmE/TrmE
VRAALQAARAAVLRVATLADRDTELAAVELQQALRALDGFVGSHTPEHLLDRIYGRFCLGK